MQLYSAVSSVKTSVTERVTLTGLNASCYESANLKGQSQHGKYHRAA